MHAQLPSQAKGQLGVDWMAACVIRIVADDFHEEISIGLGQDAGESSFEQQRSSICYHVNMNYRLTDTLLHSHSVDNGFSRHRRTSRRWTERSPSGTREWTVWDRWFPLRFDALHRPALSGSSGRNLEPPPCPPAAPLG